MILRNNSPRCVKTIKRLPPLLPIPEEESCRQWTFETKPCLPHEDPFSLVNQARANRGLKELSRSLTMDHLARLHVMQMAAVRSVFHSVSSVEELQHKLLSEKVGENVQRGDSVSGMHQETMISNSSINRSNILSEHFDAFGSATVTGDDGKIYCCHLFRKR